MFASLRMIAIVLIGSSLLGSSASAQSYLEKLEQMVEQLTQQPASSPPAKQPAQQFSEELPPPNTTELSPLLTPPAATPPALIPSSPAPQAQLGQVFLGLEAEGLTGGGIGIRVTEVSRESPAWSAGFQSGDQIIALDGFAIADLNAFAERLGKTVPGQTVRFLVTRNSRNIELVTVLMAADLARKIAVQNPPDKTSGWLGVTASDLSPQFRAQFGTRAFRGAAVTSVAAGSPARLQGIQAGDCIVEMSAAPIDNAQDLQRLLAMHSAGETIDLVLYRGISHRIVSLTLQVEPGTIRTPQRPRTNRPVPAPVRPAPIRPAPAVRPKPTPGGSSPEKDAIIAQLQSQVANLKKELDATNQQLDETQQRLIGILESLRVNRNP